jgi:hypothetical protein
MRQIGVRDEARLLADYEHCGRELCCRTFIRNLEPVTMRMAKMQKTTLDPSKISGHCGRLMCCLRFEDAVYSSLQAEMPSRGSICVTENFTGEVVSTDIFHQEIQILLPDGSPEIIRLSEIKEIRGRRAKVTSNPPQSGSARPDAAGRGNARGRPDAPAQPASGQQVNDSQNGTAAPEAQPATPESSGEAPAPNRDED